MNYYSILFKDLCQPYEYESEDLWKIGDPLPPHPESGKELKIGEIAEGDLFTEGKGDRNFTVIPA